MSAKYLVIDTETSGLYPTKHGLIQFAGVVCDEKLEILDELKLDINPGNVEISQEALKISGFTTERIQDGISLLEFVEKLEKFLVKHFTMEKKPVIIGQFWPFDFAQIQQICVNFNKENLIQNYLQNDFIDTKVLVNFANLLAESKGLEIPFKLTSLSKLGGLKDKLGIDQNKFQAHDAMGDVLATLEVLKVLVFKFEFRL